MDFLKPFFQYFRLNDRKNPIYKFFFERGFALKITFESDFRVKIVTLELSMYLYFEHINKIIILILTNSKFFINKLI